MLSEIIWFTMTYMGMGIYLLETSILGIIVFKGLGGVQNSIWK